MIDIDVHKANYHDYSKKQLLRIIGELQDKTYRLEKALDKACDELEKWDIRNFDNPDISITKDQWREWCMKDACKVIYEDTLNNLRLMEREYNLKNYNQIAPQINCDIIEELIKRHLELVENHDKYKKALDNAIKECCINVSGSDACNSLDELYEAFERKVWEDVE